MNLTTDIEKSTNEALLECKREIETALKQLTKNPDVEVGSHTAYKLGKATIFEMEIQLNQDFFKLELELIYGKIIEELKKRKINHEPTATTTTAKLLSKCSPTDELPTASV